MRAESEKKKVILAHEMLRDKVCFEPNSHEMSFTFRDNYITNSSPRDGAAILPVCIVNVSLILYRSLICLF